MKSLKIDSYIDGFSHAHLNCIDIPIAGAAGFYNYDYYYFYCFYFCYFNNWEDFYNVGIEEFRNEVLKKMGLVMRSYSVKNEDELLLLMKKNIDNNQPVIMIPNYNALFYHYDYLSNNNARHGIIVSDYNENNSTITIREGSHIDIVSLENPIPIRRGQALVKLQITEEQIKTIWKMSADSNIYVIEPISKPEISTYSALILDIISNYKFQRSNLVKLVENCMKTKNEMQQSRFLQQNIKIFVNSITVLFDIFEKVLGESTRSKRYNEFKDKYLTHRKLIITKLCVIFIKEKQLAKENADKFVNEIMKFDTELLSLVKDYYDIFEMRENQKANLSIQKNYALNAKAKASSELFIPSINNRYSASRAINGRWENMITDAWASDNLNPVNWLLVDLGQERKINKFVIRHLGGDHRTVNYKIQGRNKGTKWLDMVKISDNKSDLTIHEIEPCIFRYFRIYILKPSELTLQAIILEFEIWGDV